MSSARRVLELGRLKKRRVHFEGELVMGFVALEMVEKCKSDGRDRRIAIDGL